MLTRTLSFPRRPLGRRALIAGVGALALMSTVYLGLQGAPDESAFAANREVEMHVARLPVETLDDLTKQSDAVVVGRVIGAGKTKFILPEAQQPRPFAPSGPPADLPADKRAELGKAPAPPSRQQENIITPPPGIPTTEFTIEVSRVLRGNLPAGSRITVTQMGGVFQMPLGPGAPTLTRTMVAEHDPLMVPGHEHVLFLKRSADGGYHVTGGPDGRFGLDARRHLQPVDDGSPVGKAHRGKTIEDLDAAMRRVR